MPIGTDKLRIENGKTLDACPACGQWHARDIRSLQPWTCTKCQTEWGAKRCPECHDGGLMTVETADGQHAVCVLCGHNPTVAVELPRRFSERTETMNLEIIHDAKTPGRGLSRLQCQIQCNKDDYAFLQRALGSQINGAHNVGFNEGMLQAVAAGWKLQDILDNIIARAHNGMPLKWGDATWTVTAVDWKPEGRHETIKAQSTIADREVTLTKGSPDGWDEVFPTLLQETSPSEDQPDPERIRRETDRDDQSPGPAENTPGHTQQTRRSTGKRSRKPTPRSREKDEGDITDPDQIAEVEA